MNTIIVYKWVLQATRWVVVSSLLTVSVTDVLNHDRKDFYLSGACFYTTDQN
ncbi:MAG: hypothetical protein ABW047_04880 [Nitrospiraceae bacterium]